MTMAAPPTPRPPDPAVLMDELVEEFLLRLPPEDPALLARAALVSRQWYRVATGPAFRRRFRELYRSTTPLLGYIVNLADSIRFVPLSSFRPPHAHRPGVRAVSSSHGRVLLHRLSGKDLVAPRVPVEDLDVLLSVWHPITDEQQDLPVVSLRPNRARNMVNWDAAFICAAVGDGCEHLHCHFTVVFVGNRDDRNFTCFYSSEAGSWSGPVFAAEESENAFLPGNFVLIGTALYTTCAASNEIFKYDLQTHQMANISITPGPGVGPNIIGHGSRLIAAEDGTLGFANTSNSTLGLWLTENGILEESRAIDLHMLLPADAMPDPVQEPYEAILAKPRVVAFADSGAGVIFLWTRAGYFTIDLKSGSCKKVGEFSPGRVVPYVSFCTPALGAVSTDDRLGAGSTPDPTLVAILESIRVEQQRQAQKQQRLAEAQALAQAEALERSNAIQRQLLEVQQTLKFMEQMMKMTSSLPPPPPPPPQFSGAGPSAMTTALQFLGYQAPGAVSTDDRPGAGVAVSTDELPVADIMVSTDEGPGAGVAVTADEAPGAGVAVTADEGPGAAGMCQVP